AVLILGLTVAVVLGLLFVLWRAHTTTREGAVAIVSGVVLAAWAVTAMILARRGYFVQPDGNTPPPIGSYLVLGFVALAIAVVSSRTLRRLLANQQHLIWLNVWRLVGAVFLILAAYGQMPALWALPAGIGDVIVGVAAPWIANGIDKP